MQQFIQIITDPLGLHARPAGLLAKTAKGFSDTTITIAKGDNEVKATQLIKLMGLGVKQGDRITVTAEGPAEAEAIVQMQLFFSENL